VAKKATVSKKKKLKNIPNGIAYIHSTFNNTVVTITDTEGKVIAWKSGGTSGFKGTKKGTPFAAQIAAEQATELEVTRVVDITPVPHNGARPPKKRI